MKWPSLPSQFLTRNVRENSTRRHSNSSQRALRWMAHGSSMISDPSRSELVVIPRGNPRGMERQSLSKLMTSMLPSRSSKIAASPLISKKLRRQFVGWHNSVIQTGTNSSFTNERNNEARIANVEGIQNAEMTKAMDYFLICRISSCTKSQTKIQFNGCEYAS